MKTKLTLLFLFCFFHGYTRQHAHGTSRTIINLNQNWEFAKDPDKKGNSQLKYGKVNLPHTWNALDVMDDQPGYYRGVGYYKKKLTLSPSWKGKHIYLQFAGANQEATVLLNGKIIGKHIGGYNGFRIPLQHLKFNNADELIVKVDNSYNENIPPLTADFTFFGGLYRNVSLMVVEPTHFDETTYGADGVYVHAENVDANNADIHTEVQVKNSTSLKYITVSTVIIDATSKKIGESKTQSTIDAGQIVRLKIPLIKVHEPQLWSPESPYLYQAVTSISDTKTGKILDEVTTKIGLRFFSFDAKKGFYLNGVPLKLIGASRHQDYEGLGNAVPSALQVKDVEMLKSMGGNFLRVAHYPQDQAVLDACDRLGILTSVEIPIVNEITEKQAFYDNCMHMQKEMIKQNYNHPSIIMWAYMNEVLLRMRFGAQPERKAIYLKNIEKLAQQLEDLTRKMDPTRYTMMANHGDLNGYMAAGLTKIPMVVGWNLYQGWYGGKIEDFGSTLDRIFTAIPDKPMMVMEYGADVDPRIHAFNPVRFDKSLEYGMLYHQGYIKDILSRPFIAGAAAWNLSDFNSETRSETMPHINNKGLLTLGRQPKNTYYLYQAHLSKQPFIKIGDGSWKQRGGTTSNQPLTVLSNLDSVTLTVNDQVVGTKAVNERLSIWHPNFKNGNNKIIAVGKKGTQVIKDSTNINFVLQPVSFLTGQQSFNILLGAERQFIDDQQRIWLPSEAYNGKWGHIGGEAYKMKNGRERYGSDKNIIGTANDPIYQTQSVGIEKYTLKVPKGKYRLVLHFAELESNGTSTQLPYNLDSLIAQHKTADKELPQQRSFEVYLNDKKVIAALNLAAKYGVAKAVQFQFECLVADDKGINVSFKSITGKAVLNALQVEKVN